jgi:sirohydrochlorin ferrochelatase
MELAEPSILQACKRCIEQGAKRIVCHPFFLGRGKHVQEDIPRLVKEAQESYSNIEITLTQPTGSHDNVISLIHDTIGEALDR